MISRKNLLRPFISSWPGQVHDVLGITGDSSMLVFDCFDILRYRVFECSSVECRVSLSLGNFFLVSSVRPSSARYAG